MTAALETPALANDAQRGSHCACSDLLGRSGEYAGRLRKEEWEVRPVEIAAARELVGRYHYAT